MSNPKENQQIIAPANAEHTVPIRIDARTFTQREHDMVSNLERNRKLIAAGANQLRGPHEAMVKRDPRPDWSNEVDKWVMAMHRRWYDAIRRTHRNLFTLVPMIHHDAVPFVPVGALGPMGRLSAIMHQMQKQLDTLDEYLINPADLLSYVDPMTSEMTALSEQIQPDCPLGYLPESYVMNERGEVTFRARFNTKGFHPDQLHVTASKNRLTVSGKRSTRTDTASSVSEFSRTIYLPDSVDHTRFECHLTKDGVLTVEAPVTGVKHESIAIDSNAQLAVRPRNPEDEGALELSGVSGVQLVPSKSGGGGQMVHVEVPVDADFTADDLLVQVDANRVLVSGEKRVVEGSERVQGEYVKQFTRSYLVPQTLDTLSLRSQLIDHTLVVEAPLLPTP